MGYAGTISGFLWGTRLRWWLPALILLALVVTRCSQRPQTWLSLDPANAYTGTASCQPCHERITASYLETGMGKSLYAPDRGRIIEEFGPAAVVYDPQVDFHYRAFWQGEEMFMEEFRLENGDTTYRRRERVDFVVGSGHQTRSYLMLRQDYLYEMPLTWYVAKGIWDLSPGYDVNNPRFDREIGVECLACHTGFIDHVAGSKNRYRFISEGIDCEKCHGPGQRHIELIEGGQLIDVGEETDFSIVNPSKLPLEAQFDVCQQCHLQGVNVFAPGKGPLDFRPAMPLDTLVEVFIEQQVDPEAFGIASHAERLQQARCFIGSAGQLTCTTCHDPHRSIATTDSMVYVRQCQSCHQVGHEALCAMPEGMTGNCISCHMPAGGTSDIPHVRFHDHKIRVIRPQDSLDVAAVQEFLRLRCATSADPPPDVAGQAWLLYYEQQERDPLYLDRAANLLAPDNAYAQARLAYYRSDYAAARAAIEIAMREQPQEALYPFLSGEIYEAAGRYEEALSAYRRSWALRPESIEAGLKTGVTLLKARPGLPGTLEEAAEIFEGLRAAKPFDRRILTNLGFVYLNQGKLGPAEAALVEALGYDPDDRQALENMILLQTLKGNAILARRYLRQLGRRHPDDPALPGLHQQVETM
ncbi:MAG: hypothetical protein D6722_28730 [Bacteroidetes bacterium]|nr:MAG: hypothetical protein D6722_28730 [Bacteroidota bacterium]